jgi:hypothetical protein
MKWLTKSHIKVGRIGCAWLIHRFVDHNPQFVFSDGGDSQRRSSTSRRNFIPCRG